jgi:hypothetical protein
LLPEIWIGETKRKAEVVSSHRGFGETRAS